jgi:uncharacterized protein YcbK (DUF882 family)
MKLSSPKLITSNALTRRKLIMGGAAAASSLILPHKAPAGIAGTLCLPTGGTGAGGNYSYDEDFSDATPLDDAPGEKRVQLRAAQTGSIFNDVFYRDGAYVPEALEKWNYVCRDWRNNEVKKMDPRLLDIIWDLTDQLNITAPWQLNSGYRSPSSNAELRRQGKGAAKNSQHLYGRANDLVNPQKSPGDIYNKAIQLRDKRGWGGCGRYGSFTHIDTRSWVAQWG